MDDNSHLPPSNAEGADAALNQSAELQAYFSALHEQFAVTADAPVSAGLAEFVDVIDLTPTPLAAAASPTTSRRPKMLTGIGAFVATTTGKIVLGTSIAAASVGGMHAADIVDVPLLPEPAKAEVLMVDVEDEGTEVEEAAAAPEEEAVEVDEAVEAPADADNEDEGDEAEDGDDEEPKNHGAVVSEFAKTTELEGCEKGQAISELARSKPKKKDADNEDETDDSDEADELDDEADDEEEDKESKCKSDDEKDDDEDDSDSDEDDDEDDEDEDGDGPPEGKGHNRDGHPGKGKKADSDE